jgi:hypothetical protein
MNGLWFSCLLAFNLVEIVSRGYKIVSPNQLPHAETNAILTMLKVFFTRI